MDIRFLGAAREVGRSGFLVSGKKRNILLDYGNKINPTGNVFPIPVNKNIDLGILSHAHLDHSGGFPILFKNSEFDVYMAPPTLPLSELLVRDSIKVTKLRGFPEAFSESNMKRFLKNVKTLPYGRKKSIRSDIDLEFGDAGHIVGAAMSSITFEDTHILYTGDFKSTETHMHAPARDDYKGVDVLITESTYSGESHPERQKLEDDFVGECSRICDNGGSVLLPAFAVGRSQELAALLNDHRFKHPVYIDGMSNAVSEIMLEFPDYVRDYDDLYRALKNVEWVKSGKQRRLALEEPSVIISPAGMLQGGHSVNYMLKMREHRNSAVFITGYQVKGTPGRSLLDSKHMTIDGYDIDFSHLEIRKFDFSAHAGSNELQRLVKKTDPKLVFCVHGDDEKAQGLGKWCRDEGYTAFAPKPGEEYRVSDYL